MMKKVILLMSLLMILPLVSGALEDLGTYKQDRDVLLVQLCGDCTFNNITSVTAPDSTNLVRNQIMTQNGSRFVYNLVGANTTTLGTYRVNGVGDLGGTNQVWAYTFDITASGSEADAFPIELSFIIVGFIIIMVGKVREEFKIFKHLGAMFIIIMGIITLYPGYGNIHNSTLTGLGIGFVNIGIGFYYLLEDSFSFDKQVKTYQQDDDGRFHD